VASLCTAAPPWHARTTFCRLQAGRQQSEPTTHTHTHTHVPNDELYATPDIHQQQLAEAAARKWQQQALVAQEAVAQGTGAHARTSQEEEIYAGVEEWSSDDDNEFDTVHRAPAAHTSFMPPPQEPPDDELYAQPEQVLHQQSRPPPEIAEETYMAPESMDLGRKDHEASSNA